jgi:hypothetical protein
VFEKHLGMKKVLLIIALIMGIQVCYAQTWDEWWRQKKTQINYLFKQIAALQVYTEYLEKGYKIAKDGTHLINDIKHGDFDLHSDYFSSLKSVNSTIRHSSRVSEIISIQTSIIRGFKKLLSYCEHSGQFTAEELKHIHSVYESLTKECSKDIDELVLVITSGELEMKDDERLKRIESIYNAIQDQYAFTQSFCNETSMLAFSRISEQMEINRSKKLMGY